MATAQAIVQIQTYLPGDGDEPRFVAWTAGETWNGCPCPRFEKTEAEKVIAHLNDDDPQPQGPAYYDADKDVFVTPDANEPTDYQEWIGFDWEGKRVYAIGAWYWTWEADT